MTLRHLAQTTVLAASLLLAPFARASVGAAVNSVSVMRLQPEFDLLKRTFETRGTSAVAEEIRRSLRDEQKLAAWREFAQQGEVNIKVEIHQSEREAVDFLQARLAKMGLSKLNFEGVVTEGRPNPHVPNDDEIRWHKWIRYAAGPGITLAASYFNMPAVTTGTVSDYLFIMAPMASGVVATVVLELVFANPTINNNFWKPLWNLGGPWGGRGMNVLVNFAVGLGLWATQVGGAHLPELFGGPAVPLHLIGLKQAAWEALWGAVAFNVFFGQYQTDLAYAEKEGSLTSSQRYKLETTGGVMVGGGRVAYWTLPHGIAYLGLLAEVGFAVLKTFPLAIKNLVADPLYDRKVARTLHGNRARKPSFVEQCGLALGDVGLINLPTTEKNLGSPFPNPGTKSPGPRLESAPAAL